MILYVVHIWTVYILEKDSHMIDRRQLYFSCNENCMGTWLSHDYRRNAIRIMKRNATWQSMDGTLRLRSKFCFVPLKHTHLIRLVKDRPLYTRVGLCSFWTHYETELFTDYTNDTKTRSSRSSERSRKKKNNNNDIAT